MTYQEKKFRDKQDKQSPKNPKEDSDKYNQQAGSRISEAEESGNLRSYKNNDLETLDDEDEGDLY
jgi:hypothetical protein